MLCKRIIKLKVDSEHLLDYNYQYALLKETYKNISKLDTNKAATLHNRGFNDTGKPLKNFMLFMKFYDSLFLNEGIVITKNSRIELVVSGKKEIVEIIVKSIISNGLISVNGINFNLVDVIKEKEIKFYNKVMYRAISPIVSSKYNGSNVEYLKYLDQRYYEGIINNLKRKYEQLHGKPYEKEIYFNPSCIEDILQVKSKCIGKIKGNGYIKGYGKFNFWFVADKEIQEIAYYLGFGQNNTLGAGYVEQMAYIKG